ncbi:MAG: hypothetical protein E6G56_10105 [Actinobacteria bacterium]|nr:MAG: hypothetical protein E6G56_10105 [Actinomycetota bacterium]
MARRSITTGQGAAACDVCGRTLLRGEQADVFISGGSRRAVCELCVARATHEGWIRESVDDSLGVRPRQEGRGSVLGRLRQRRGNRVRERPVGAGQGMEEAPEAPAAEAVAAGVPPRERQVHAVPTNADLKTARALDVFNASEHPRTVAGVMRSLGAPFVSVRPTESSGSVVCILVGWELCWYRYEVDLADEAAGVRLSGQGDELGELDPVDRDANGAADEQGLLYVE